MRRRNSNVDRIAVLCMIFGVSGAFIAGESGAIIGCIIAIGLGIYAWHKHDWQSQALYDTDGKPVVALKLCECGEIQFDGWFERKKTQ